MTAAELRDLLATIAAEHGDDTLVNVWVHRPARRGAVGIARVGVVGVGRARVVRIDTMGATP